MVLELILGAASGCLIARQLEKRTAAQTAARRDHLQSTVREFAAVARDGTDKQKDTELNAMLWRISVGYNIPEMAKMGAIPPLVALTRDGTDRQKGDALCVLRALAEERDITVDASIDPGERVCSVPILSCICRACGVTITDTTYRDITVDASRTNRGEIAKVGGIPPLVALVRCGTVRMGPGRSQCDAAAVLRELAVNADNKVAIADAGGIAPLLALALDSKYEGLSNKRDVAFEALRNLADNNADNQVAIATASITPLVARAGKGCWQSMQLLAMLAVNSANQVAIVDAGGIAPLVEHARNCLDCVDLGKRERAALALRNLAKGNDANQVAIAKEGGIPPLLAMLSDADGKVRSASLALGNLAKNDDNQVAIAKEGGIITPLVADLVAVAACEASGGQEEAAAALGSLAANAGKAIMKVGGVAPLVALARDGTDKQKAAAVEALRRLASHNAESQVAIAKAGGIDLLITK